MAGDDDDGLLMNFSIGEGIIKPKIYFRGGRWKDRLIAKKSSKHTRQKKTLPSEPSSGSNAIPTPPTKAIQDDSATTRPSKKQKLADPNREVVSSLFSSNPTSKPTSSAPIPTLAPPVPSNAPLVNTIDTFTTLGLSSILSAHILNKFCLTAPTAIQKSAITQLLSEDSDAFIQAETGSGKTLAYLLPIVQRIMHLSPQPSATSNSPTNSHQIHRTSGLFALILAPTRELCKQISLVLSRLLRCAHWIVAGTVIGGEKKKSEKARLRRGVNILVATPGRLADHLDNTEVLDVSRVRWLVLDEGDRLMELGFEEEIKGIVAKLEERKGAGQSAMRGLPERRTTVMCSATMKMNVHRLGEISLKDAVHIKVDEEIKLGDQATAGDIAMKNGNTEEIDFLAPAQLQQSYAVVPAKQRLVTLVALLKHTFARKGSVMKAIVFLSCADSVDFHFEIFARDNAEAATLEEPQQSKKPLTENPNHAEIGQKPMKPSIGPPTSMPQLPTVSGCPTLSSPPNLGLTIHKLHGSLAQALRTATLSAFTHSTDPCILLCTDVASRGLDLPNIDLVIEYDPPFSADDHLHRVGRTARAGREGRAVIFLMPGKEEKYVDVLKRGYRDGMENGLRRVEAEELLKKGFGLVEKVVPKGSGGRHWEESATEWQLDIERWIIDDKSAAEMARRAFVSQVRAYATHIAKEREIFDVKGLHLGHLAKAFALRERPGNMGRGVGGGDKVIRRNQGGKKRAVDGDEDERATNRHDPRSGGYDGLKTDEADAARKMKVKMKEHMTAAGEFNIA